MIGWSPAVITALFAALGGLAGCSSTDGPATKLPGSLQVPGWIRSGPVTVLETDTDLYTHIDGAAPAYIQYGWRRAAYGQYTQGTWTLELAIHEMDSAYDAQSIFDRMLPPARVTLAPSCVVDVSMPASYRSMGCRRCLLRRGDHRRTIGCGPDGNRSIHLRSAAEVNRHRPPRPFGRAPRGGGGTRERSR